jgi:hypothetical protein
LPYGCLPERRQYGRDVFEKDSIGSYDKHTLALESLAMLVEKVSNPMQTDRCLAGPRPPLNDDQVFGRPSDDLVLVGLNGRDDVAHSSRACPAQFGKQWIRHATVARGNGRGIEEVFLKNVDQDPVVVKEITASCVESQRVTNGGPVERRGRARSPVNDHGPIALVLYVSPPDVESLSRVLVDAAETKGAGGCDETRDPPRELYTNDLRINLSRAQLLGDEPLRAPTHRVQALVSKIDVVLLARDVGMRAHPCSFLPNPKLVWVDKKRTIRSAGEPPTGSTGLLRRVDP